MPEDEDTSAIAPRVAIGALEGLSPPASVDVVGRVRDEDPGEILVQDETGAAWVRTLLAPPGRGHWVRVTGTWDGERIRDARHATLNPHATPREGCGDEWAWLQGEGGRRAAILRRRAQMLRGIRRFFDGLGFLEVETPALVPSPGLDPHLDAFEVRRRSPARYLITSPEYQMKRLLAGGLPRVYQVCKCFRRDELGSLHQSEFTMLEWYRTVAGTQEIMRDTERLVAYVAAEAHGGSTVIPARDGPVDVAPPWERLTLAEAFQRYAGVDLRELLADEERFYRVLVDEVEPELGRSSPTFLTRWPAQMASLARLCPDDAAFADRVEAYVDGVELSNGFGELTDPIEQRRRLLHDQRVREAAGRPVYPVDERFLGALAEGIPPSGGNALGVDRLVMLVLGVKEIGDVVAIPQTRL